MMVVVVCRDCGASAMAWGLVFAASMHSMPGLPILRSRDLVNWTLVSYAVDKLDLGPAYRLEDGKAKYGQGIWAPSLRYHDGVFYIFSNVNGEATQGQDLVVWFVNRHHHVTRDEDEIFMPIEWTGFHISPRSFSDSNPAP